MSGSAVEWASKVDAGSGVDWTALEVQAFRRHTSVAFQLDPTGEHGGPSRPPAPRRSPLGVLLGLVGVVGLLAPLLGLVVLAVPRFTSSRAMTPDQQFQLSGILFAVVIVTLAILLVAWWRAGRGPDGLLRFYGGAGFVLGAITALLTLGPRYGDAAGPWRLVMVVAAALGLGALVVTARAAARDRRRRRAEGDTSGDGDAPDAVKPVSRIHRAIGALPVEERIAARRDRDAAITLLAERGVVPAPEAARARGAALGALAPRMSQRR